MKKIFITTMGIILLISIVVAATQIDGIISLDKIKKDKLSNIGINNPTITKCEKLDDFYCEANIYEESGINKNIKVNTKYCDEYETEQVDSECKTYQNNTEKQCNEELVYENVCRDVTTQDCSWKPFESLFEYTCEDVVENVCADEIKQTCNPYFEEQCNYEDVYDEVCEEVQTGENCNEVEIIKDSKVIESIDGELIEKEYKTICTPIMETQCNDVLNDYKNQICENVEIANCTDTYSNVCDDIVVSETCIAYEENLVSNGNCSKWKTLTKKEIEDQLINQSFDLLENIASVQESRSKEKEYLTDEIFIGFEEK